MFVGSGWDRLLVLQVQALRVALGFWRIHGRPRRRRSTLRREPEAFSSQPSKIRLRHSSRRQRIHACFPVIATTSELREQRDSASLRSSNEATNLRSWLVTVSDSCFRGVCEKYRSEFDMYTYSPMWNLADQFDVMWPQTCQDLYISIGQCYFTR